MKKILLCASALALLAGCTEDEFESARSESTKGITFAATINNGAETKGELTLGDQVGFFWYAETDKINVLAKNNVQVGGTNSDKGIVNDWGSLPTAAEYKATKSAGNGEFTAVDGANMIEFSSVPATAEIANKTTTFVATYASAVSAVTADAEGNIETVTIKPAAGNAVIALNGGKNISEFMPLYSVSTAYPTKAYHSVGEKVNLEFYRPFATLGLVANGVAEYSNLFGPLLKVTVIVEGDGEGINASEIAYEDNTTEYTIDIANPSDLTKTKVTADGTLSSEIAITYGDGSATGLDWADGRNNALLFPALSVDRSAFKEAGTKEKYKVVYDFKNITFTVEDETDEDWNAFNESNAPIVKALKGLNVAEYPFLVTKNYDLIVNSGKFADIYQEGSNKSKINWGSGVDVTSITSIVSKVELESEDLADLKSFTGLTNLKLTVNTEIPANTFSTTQAGAITNLELPAVTSIDTKFINNSESEKFTALTNLDLAAYTFPDPKVNAALFNTETDGTIATLNISAVQSMIPAFGILRELSFKDFTELTEVKVYEGVQLSASAFNGCTSLAKVDGTVKINGAVSAFDGCNAASFKAISIIGTDIPDYAFNGCTYLEKVNVNGKQVAPTKVGESAFKGTKIKYMDLSGATTLGKNAFNGSDLISNDDKTQILTVGATAIPEGAFEGTDVVMIDFTKATSIQKNILKSVTSLLQVRFNEKFTVITPATNDWAETFGSNTANVNLFVAAGQQYVSSNKLELPYGADGDVTTITFKGIYNN